MNPEQWSRMVASSVSPVVVISASALLSLALYNRLAAIISRLRAVQRERLHIQEHLESCHGDAADLNQKVLQGLADQTLHIRSRARLIRNSLLCLLAAIASLVLCSLFTGIMTLYESVTPAAAAFFILGILLVLASVTFAATELIRALAPAELETDLVTRLTATRNFPEEKERVGALSPRLQRQ